MNYGTGNPSPTGRNHHVSVVGDGFPVPVSHFMLLMRLRLSEIPDLIQLSKRFIPRQTRS